MPLSNSQTLALKKLLRKKLARNAARKYTWVWNKVIKEAQGITPKKLGKKPPGFNSTNEEKYRRALLYKNRITNYALTHPKKYNTPLYRGIAGWEVDQFMKNPKVNKNTLSSFTKNRSAAKLFANVRDTLLVINKSNKRIPSINFTNGGFKSEWNKGGAAWKKYGGPNKPNAVKEQEVLLPPGTFEKKKMVREGAYWVIYVNFIPKNNPPFSLIS